MIKGKNISTTIYISPELYNATLVYLDGKGNNSFSDLLGKVLGAFLKFDGITKYGAFRCGRKKKEVCYGKNISKPVKFSVELHCAIKNYLFLTEFTSFSELGCRVLALFLKFSGNIQYSYGDIVKVGIGVCNE